MINNKTLSVFWHSVESDCFSPDQVYPSEQLFRQHLSFLSANYTPITVPQFVEMHEHGRQVTPFRKPPLLLGFDDGFKNVLRRALPILEEFNVPAVFFVIAEVLRNPKFVPWYVEVRYLIRRTARKSIVYHHRDSDLTDPKGIIQVKRAFTDAFRLCHSEKERQALLAEFAKLLGVGRPHANDLDEDLQFVSSDDLKNLKSSSLLTIGSHGMTHRDLALLSYHEQREELEASNRLLAEHCPNYYPVVAYPNGSFNLDTQWIARRIYRAGFGVLLGASYRNLYAYPRIGLENASVADVAYLTSLKRRKYILPVKRILHATGIRVA